MANPLNGLAGQYGKPESVTTFIGTTTGPLTLLFAAIAALFVILKNLGVKAIAVETADHIVQRLGMVWPVITSQYDEIKRLGSDVDVTNFALFLAVVVPVVPAAVGWITSKYATRHERVRTHASDIMFVVVLVSIVVLALFLDPVKENPSALWDFQVDRFGLYYFRQMCVPCSAGITLSMVLIVLVDKLKRRRG